VVTAVHWLREITNAEEACRSHTDPTSEEKKTKNNHAWKTVSDNAND